MIQEPNFERRPVQYLYGDTSALHFMDLGDYNQFSLPRESSQEEAMYLVDNLEGIRSLVLDDEVIGIELPGTVDLKIVECNPAVRGNSATGRTKPATLETGLVVQVPEHIACETIVRVDTSSGKFVGRVSQ